MDKTYHLNGAFKPTTKRSADLDGPDFYPTPPWATFALIDNERFRGDNVPYWHLGARRRDHR